MPHDFQKLTRFILVGAGGGFSNAISKKIRFLFPNSPVFILSSREFGDKHFRDEIDFLLNSQKRFADEIIWCSGSSSNRSAPSDCMKDEVALRDFVSIFLKGANTLPHLSFLSSGGTVYGNAAGVVNELSELNPQSPYAEMKVRSENFLKELARDGVFELSIFRLANVYGLNKPSNRMGLVEVALKKREIFLTVSSESRKQYGSYEDYASYILYSLREQKVHPDNFVVKNIFSDHLYSISDILRVTAVYNVHGEDRVVTGESDSSIIETVILTSIHPVAKFNFKWQSLEDYVGGVNS